MISMLLTLVLGVLGCGGSSSEEPGVITVTVKDQISGDVIEGAKVQVLKTEEEETKEVKNKTTDETGIVVIKDLALEANFSLLVSKEGYEDGTLASIVAIEDDETNMGGTLVTVTLLSTTDKETAMTAAGAYDTLASAVLAAGDITRDNYADQKTAIASAEAAYADLSELAKTYVSAATDFSAQSTAIQTIEDEIAAEAAAQAAAEAYDAAVALIPAEVTADNYADAKSAIETAAALYADLNEMALALVTEYDATAALAAIKGYEDAAAAAAYNDLVAAIAAEVTRDNYMTVEAAIAAAATAYDALNAEAKAMVTEYDATAANAAIQAIKDAMAAEEAAAAAVTTAIEALPAEVTAETGADVLLAVNSANTAYTALNDNAKALVSDANKTKLAELVAAVAALAPVDTIVITSPADEAVTMWVGDTITVEATVTMENAEDTVADFTVSSSDAAVTVDGKVITAAAAGTATVTVTAGVKTDTFTVTVNAPTVVSIDAGIPSTVSLGGDFTVTPTIVMDPETATAPAYTVAVTTGAELVTVEGTKITAGNTLGTFTVVVTVEGQDPISKEVSVIDSLITAKVTEGPTLKNVGPLTRDEYVATLTLDPSVAKITINGTEMTITDNTVVYTKTVAVGADPIVAVVLYDAEDVVLEENAEYNLK